MPYEGKWSRNSNDSNEMACTVYELGSANCRAARICSDYKVTVNRAMEIDTYHLPQFKDLFALLSRGKIFSKLDQVGCIPTNSTV